MWTWKRGGILAFLLTMCVLGGGLFSRYLPAIQASVGAYDRPRAKLMVSSRPPRIARPDRGAQRSNP